MIGQESCVALIAEFKPNSGRQEDTSAQLMDVPKWNENEREIEEDVSMRRKIFIFSPKQLNSTNRKSGECKCSQFFPSSSSTSAIYLESERGAM